LVPGQARVLAAGVSDVGRKRTHNEDSFAIVDNEHLFLVADGMGGHSSGEIASRMAIETMSDFFAATSADPEATWPYKMDKTRGYEENRLVTGIKLANRRIFEASQRETRLHGMGTTMVALLAVRDGALIGHVGDSRVYRYRGNALEQLTEDHSLLNDYLKMKSMTPEEIENFPHKNVIVRALGMKETVKVDAIYDKPKPGDLYILCSDGLCGPTGDDDIREIVTTKSGNLRECGQALIDRANEKGGPDNITVVLCRWVGSS
jgi:protein phosphatase